MQKLLVCHHKLIKSACKTCFTMVKQDTKAYYMAEGRPTEAGIFLLQEILKEAWDNQNDLEIIGEALEESNQRVALIVWLEQVLAKEIEKKTDMLLVDEDTLYPFGD